jgi:CBS domain-containing protein
MPLTPRQKKIVQLVQEGGPLTGETIARQLKVTRAALRSDLAVLVTVGLLAARTKVGYFLTDRENHILLPEEIASILVRDIQSLPVAVNSAANAYDAMVAMFTEDVGSVFVVEAEGRLSGVVSRKDLLKAAQTGEGRLYDMPVKMVMTSLPRLVVTRGDESVIEAARKIIENEVDSLPVVQETDQDKKNFKLVGRLTKTNLTRLLLDLAEKKGGICHN